MEERRCGGGPHEDGFYCPGAGMESWGERGEEPGSRIDSWKLPEAEVGAAQGVIVGD